jgi:hypothetical protein
MLSITLNLILFYLILIVSETNFYLGVIIVYYAINFIGIFFNSVLVAYIKIGNEGLKPTLSGSFKVALGKIDKIIYWSLFQATVGYILAILESNKFLRVFVIIAEVAWAFVTYFVVPIIILEDLSVTQAVANSKKLIKNYWTEGLKGEFFLSIFFLIIFLTLLIVFIWAANSGYQVTAKNIFIFGAVVLFISLIINSALIQIYHTFLYLYLKD